MTAYNGQTITYDAIGNPLNDGERQYEWEAGRGLKKMIVKGDPADGIEDGFDEGSATSLKLEFSNGNLLTNGVADTVITAKVYRKNVDVTDEYAATAFNWTRTSGDESADASWNAAHSGMKSITVSASKLSDDIQIQCTLTGTSPAYGSVNVNDSFIVSHTRSVADSNDTLSIEDGTLFVTTDDDNYRLSGNELTALYPRLNGAVTANAWIYHTQPTKTIEFKYNSAGLRVQKKVTANGKTEVTDYTLHGKLVTHMTVGNDKLHFFYDNSSRPAKVNFNGVTYIYLHNLQGDVVGIIDNGGNLVVEYKYDAWGRAISITGSLAATLGKRNPFRYRGYVFDEESGLYYLRSRYYSPAVGRFVNMDLCIGRVARVSSHNVFSYCACSPVHLRDDSGYQPEDAFQTVVVYAFIFSNIPWRKFALTEISSIVGEKKDYPLADKLFSHFLWGFGRALSKKQAKEISTTLIKSPKFISAILNDYNEQGKYIVSSVDFKSGDLHYAIGKANYKATVTKDNDMLLVTGELWDTYDFTEIRNPFDGKGSFFSDAANDFGVYLQYKGEGKAYGYIIPFEMFIILE